MFLSQKEYQEFLKYCYFSDISPLTFQEGYLGIKHEFADNSTIATHLKEWLEAKQNPIGGLTDEE